MSLERVHDTWEGLGRTDPMWAVLSDPQKKGNRWDADEFYDSGKIEIAALMLALEDRSLSPERQRCLDFGCGVGRLTEALVEYFASADGVDIADSMIQRARDHNKHGDRCHYHVNVRDDLSLFADSSFDLVYSNIVLQHMDPKLAEGYVEEFFRVLRPGGLAVFQIPSINTLKDGSHLGVPTIQSARLVDLRPRDSAVLRVRIRNNSPYSWPSSVPIRVGNHWLDSNGTVVIPDDGRAPLGKDLEPDDEVEVELPVTAPGSPGSYLLEVDLVEEGTTWFSDRGSPTARMAVDIKSPPVRQRASNYLKRLRNPSPANEVVADRESYFEMHGVPKERVVEVVSKAGGEIADIERFDVAGPEWESYRYFAKRRVAVDS